ncbi:MAG: NAD(P)/FAD-dependent oxidoreductase [Prevotella sp.]|nr:NAD(P)/FAD-dependent oxidoreductase [Prevotella sp.]
MHNVVIIGSGLGGLICARQLAQSGRSVVVLERQREPGGCLQSYRRCGLEFDTGLHYVGGLAGGQPLHDAFVALGLLELPWHKLDADGFDQITIGGQTFPMAEGFDRFADTLGDCFPQERGALRQYVDLLRHLPPMDESVHVNAYDYLTSLFRDPLLVNVVSGSAMRMELRRESLPLFHFAHGISSYIQSSWRLKGSGRLIVESLIKDIVAAGGEVCCQAEVRELKETGGRIVGATCTNGNIYEGEIFISDVHPQLTFGWLGDAAVLKGTFRRRIAALQNTFGIFTVSLVLKPGALPYFNYNKYVYREANVWESPLLSPSGKMTVDRVMVSCRVPEDNTPSSQGRSENGLQVDLLTPMPWTLCQPWKDTVVGRRRQDYEQMKEQMADDCIRLAEQVIPGLGAMVAKRYTSTPLTWRDYTLSPCGSAFGVRKDCRNPLMTNLSPRTPIPNLFLTGQSLVLHGLEGVTMTALQTTDLVLNRKP